MSVSGAAMTLGRAHGAVLLGQALKLSIPIRSEQQEDVSTVCFEADVFYGDVKQDIGLISVNREFSVTTRSGVVEVISRARVDEPVVTVYLRAGCEQKTTRRYVLLADPASEVASAPPIDQARSSAQVAALPGVGRPLQEEIPVRPSRKPVVVAPPVERGPDAAVPKNREARAATAPRPRLKLAPVDLSMERDLVLKLSSSVVVAEVEDLHKRAEAVALWRALNASPQDILRSDARRQSMEADLQGLQTVTAKNAQALQELTTRLERAESERYLNPVVYGLFAVLLLSGVGVVYAWLRLRQRGQTAGPWWHHVGTSERQQWGNQEPSSEHEGPATSGATEPVLAAAPMGGPLNEVDIDLHTDAALPGETHEEVAHATRGRNLDEPTHATARASGHMDFGHSMTASLRALNTQEMMDVRQQAEFFMTLGQHEEAISVLKDSINTSADSNPLVYLELLRVLHTLGRKVEYDHYRAEFNGLFSGHVPPYAEFGADSTGLESYSDICRRLCATWPSDEAVGYIEQCLVRAPGDDPASGLDLEAFRDLLMLHGIARRLAATSESRLQPFSAARSSSADTSPSPSAYLATGAMSPDLHHAGLDGQAESGAATLAAVDLDLSEPPGNLIDFNADDLGSFKPPMPRAPT